MDTLVEYAIDGQVARLTLNSPHNRNALSSTLVGQLHQGLRDAADDPAVRVVVLGHTGNTFCAGADLSEGSAASADPAEATAQRSWEMATLLRAIVELPRPVIVAVDGHVRAGGMGLVAAADLAVAGPRSTFALTEARIGVAPAIISLTLLPKLSARAAARYYLTGETFTAGSGGVEGADHRRCAGRVRPGRRAAGCRVGAAVRLRRSARGHAGVPAEAAAELGVRIGAPATTRRRFLR